MTMSTVTKTVLIHIAGADERTLKRYNRWCPCGPVESSKFPENEGRVSTLFLESLWHEGVLCYWQALLALSVPDSWKQFKTSFRGGTQRFLKRPLKHVSRTSCIRFPQSKQIQGKSYSSERHVKLLLVYFCIHGHASLMCLWGYL